MQNYQNIEMKWSREGLHLERGGQEFEVIDCCQLALLKIGYNDNLDETPAGWRCSRRERVLNWLKTTNSDGGVSQNRDRAR